MSQSFVKVAGLTKRFGPQTAVNAVSLDVVERQTLALLGPSGCGKTTILRCLAGLEKPESGSIEIDGEVVFDGERGINLMPEQRRLGIVFQSYAVWPHMTVAENVGFPLKVRKVAKPEMRARVTRILELVGLGAVIDKPATQLSGGQQQRVALARALVHEPRLVLFDEPMSNLDAQLREQVRLELKVLQARLGFTAIYVTHDQSEAFALADQIIIMNRGHIEASGPPKAIFHAPQTPFVARFLGLNALEGSVARTTTAEGASYAEVAVKGLRIWGRVGNGAALRIGDPVVACVRREHVGVGPVKSSRTASDEPPLQSFAGKVRTSSFLGLAEEFSVEVGNVELRAVQPYLGTLSGDVEVTIYPDHCIVLADSYLDGRPG